MLYMKYKITQNSKNTFDIVNTKSDKTYSTHSTINKAFNRIIIMLDCKIKPKLMLEYFTIV